IGIANDIFIMPLHGIYPAFSVKQMFNQLGVFVIRISKWLIHSIDYVIFTDDFLEYFVCFLCEHDKWFLVSYFSFPSRKRGEILGCVCIPKLGVCISIFKSVNI